MTEIKDWIKDRAKEPSTWRGLSILLGLTGVGIAPELVMQIGAVVMSILGGIEVARKEPPKE